MLNKIPMWDQLLDYLHGWKIRLGFRFSGFFKMRKSLFVCCWPVWYVKWYSSTYRVSKQVLGKLLSHVPKLIKVRLILIRWFSAIKPNFCELYNYNVAQWVPYPELVWTSCTHVMWYFLCISQSWKQNCAEVYFGSGGLW